MMTSKNWDVVALLFKITTVLKLSPTLLTQKMPWPSVFLTNKISPLQSALFLCCPPIFSPFIHIPLSAFEPPGFLPLQHRNPLHQHGKHTPPLFLLHLRGQLTPFRFQLASPPRIHMDSWWAVRNPNQGPNGPTTLLETDLELTGLSHVGFGPQNY